MFKLQVDNVLTLFGYEAYSPSDTDTCFEMFFWFATRAVVNRYTDANANKQMTMKIYFLFYFCVLLDVVSNFRPFGLLRDCS